MLVKQIIALERECEEYQNIDRYLNGGNLTVKTQFKYLNKESVELIKRERFQRGQLSNWMQTIDIRHD